MMLVFAVGVDVAYRGMTCVHFCFWCVWICLFVFGMLNLVDLIFGPFGLAGALDALIR